MNEDTEPDEDLDEFVDAKGISVGELKRRARGESGTPEEQEAARREIAEVNQRLHAASAGVLAKIQGQTKAIKTALAYKPPVIQPLDIPTFEPPDIDIESTPAFRTAEAVEGVLAVQEAQAEFNEELMKKQDKHNTKLSRLAWWTLAVAFLTLVATVLGVAVTAGWSPF